jgi:hypothetical protein
MKISGRKDDIEIKWICPDCEGISGPAGECRSCDRWFCQDCVDDHLRYGLTGDLCATSPLIIEQIDAAKTFLRDALADGAWHLSIPIIEAAEERGIPFRILAAARDKLNVFIRVAGGHWEWLLFQQVRSRKVTEE